MNQALWDDAVKPGLRGMTRAVFSPATYVSNSDDTLTLSLPNPVHRDKCEQHRATVEKALAASVGSPVTLDLVIAGDGGPGGGSGSGPSGSGNGNQASAAGEPGPRSAAPAAVVAPDNEPIDPSHPAAGALADDAPQPARESPRRAAERKAAEAAANGSVPVGDDDQPLVTDAEIHVLPEDHEVDLTELIDAPPESVKTPIDRLAEAFPGSELVTEAY